MCFIVVVDHSVVVIVNVVVDVAVIVVVVGVVVAQFIAMLLIAKGLGYTREHIAVDEWRYYVRTISILYPYLSTFQDTLALTSTCIHCCSTIVLILVLILSLSIVSMYLLSILLLC